MSAVYLPTLTHTPRVIDFGARTVIQLDPNVDKMAPQAERTPARFRVGNGVDSLGDVVV